MSFWAEDLQVYTPPCISRNFWDGVMILRSYCSTRKTILYSSPCWRKSLRIRSLWPATGSGEAPGHALALEPQAIKQCPRIHLHRHGRQGTRAGHARKRLAGERQFYDSPQGGTLIRQLAIRAAISRTAAADAFGINHFNTNNR